MADSKITALTAISTVDPTADPLVVVDVSDTSMAASGTTKKSTINQLLGAGGTATLASATITGAATVGTTLGVTGASALGGSVGIGAAASAKLSVTDANGIPIRFGDIAAAPVSQTACFVGVSTSGLPGSGNGDLILVPRTSDNRDVIIYTGSGTAAERYRVNSTGVATWSNVGGVAGTAMTLNSTGLGVGVTPSAWSTYKAIQVGQLGAFWANPSGTDVYLSANQYFGSGSDRYIANGLATIYKQNAGVHSWLIAPSGTAGNAITFTQAMTLDASGNLLVGPSTATSHTFYKNASDGSLLIDFSKSGGFPSFRVYTCNAAVDPNAAEAVAKFWRSATTSRSINAAGTVNASGADYAEYMTKASDFVLAKGDVAGIDANGKLTNVFADAVSFVVKSTDPSYVGNDKWGVGLEGDDLEAARQLVDRIAFAGQVPVNVTGAKAGDYIVPVANGTGIKGQAVSNPTFEQYQLAVGKVIGIDADGRARIIVKVA